MKKTAAFFAMLSQVGVVCNAGTRGFPSQAFSNLPAARILRGIHQTLSRHGTVYAEAWSTTWCEGWNS